jgi:hypothetical protein
LEKNSEQERIIKGKRQISEPARLRKAKDKRQKAKLRIENGELRI